MSQETPEPIAFTQNQREEVRLLGDKASTLSSQPGTHQQTYIAEPVVLLERAAFNAGINALYTPFIGETYTTPTLVAKGPHAVLTPIAFMMREDAVNNTFHAKEVEVALCLQALRPAVTSHHAQNLVAQPTAYIMDSFTSNSMLSDNPNSGCREVDKTKCLDTACLNPTANQGGVMVVQKLYENHPNDSRVTGPHEIAPTVVSRYGTGGGNVPLVNSEPSMNDELLPIPIQDGRELEKNQNGLGVAKPGDPAYTLDTTGAQAVAMRESGQGFWMQDDKAGTLRAEGENRPSRPSHVIGEPAYTLDTTGAQGVFQVQAFYSNESQAHLCPPNICPPIKVGSAGTCGNPPAVLVQEPLAVDTFNQTLSPLNQTLRAGTDVDRMGGVLESREVIPTLTARMQGSSGWAPYNETAHILPVIAPTVTTCKGSKGGSSSEAIDEIVALHQAEQANNPICSDITGTLTVGHHSCAGHQHRMGDHSFLVGDAVAFQPGNLRRKAGADPSTETFPTLKCDSGDQSPHVATFKWGNSAQAHTIGYSEQNSPTLTAGGGGNMIPAVMHPNQSQGVDLFNQTLTGDVHVPLRTAQGHGAPAAIAPTLTAANDPSRSPQSSEVTQQVNAVHQVTMAVRRLTPRECERLQGFPDDWSQIPWKGKPASECPDGPRYKACGNSMAVPVMRWIGSRINAKHKELYG